MLASVLNLSRSDCKALELKDAYSLHRIIYSLFPKQDDKTRDFLFVDKGGDWNSRQILILSDRVPENPRFGEVRSKEIPPSFLEYDGHTAGLRRIHFTRFNRNVLCLTVAT